MNFNHVLIKVPAACEMTGLSRSALYAGAANGLLPKLVKVGARASAVPAREIEAVNAARIAGKSDDEIRALVSRMHAARTSIAA